MDAFVDGLLKLILKLLESAFLPVLVALAGYIVQDIKNKSERRKLANKTAVERAKLMARHAEERETLESRARELESKQDAFILEQAQKQADYSRQLFETQTQLNATREQLDREVNHSREQDQLIGQLQQAKTTADAEIRGLRDAKEKAERNIDGLINDLRTRSKANLQTKRDNEALTRERDLLNQKVATLTEKVKQLETQVKELKDQAMLDEQSRQRFVLRSRYALREAGKLMNESQKNLLDDVLASKDIHFADLMLPPGEVEPPDTDERIQQLRHIADFHSHEKRALITMLTERGVSQSEIDRLLNQVHDSWRPPDESEIQKIA